MSSVTSVVSGRASSSRQSGQELVEADRIDHRARQDMSADFGALLDHDDGDVLVELLETDRRREAGRTGADDDDVIVHALARFALRFLEIHPALRRPARPHSQLVYI